MSAAARFFYNICRLSNVVLFTPYSVFLFYNGTHFQCISRGRYFTVQKFICMLFFLRNHSKMSHSSLLFVIFVHLSKFTQNTDKTQNWPVFYGISLSTTLQFVNESCQDPNCLNQRLCKHDSNEMIRRFWIFHLLSASEMTVCKK